MDVREISPFFLYRPLGSLAAGFLRNCLMGFLYGGVFLAGYALYETLTWSSSAGLVIIGLAVSFALWTSSRLWSFTLLPVIERTGKVVHLMTRIPYWFVAGGIGYTVGLLIIKKMNFFAVQDIPVKALFSFGGKFCAGVQLLFECFGLFLSGIRKNHDQS